MFKKSMVLISLLPLAHAIHAMEQLLPEIPLQKSKFYCDSRRQELVGLFDLLTMNVNNQTEIPIFVAFNQRIKKELELYTLDIQLRTEPGEHMVYQQTPGFSHNKCLNKESDVKSFISKQGNVSIKTLEDPLYYRPYQTTCDFTVRADENDFTMAIKSNMTDVDFKLNIPFSLSEISLNTKELDAHFQYSITQTKYNDSMCPLIEILYTS